MGAWWEGKTGLREAGSEICLGASMASSSAIFELDGHQSSAESFSDIISCKGAVCAMLSRPSKSDDRIRAGRGSTRKSSAHWIVPMDSANSAINTSKSR